MRKWVQEQVEKWFPKTKPLNALDAYTLTRYGKKMNIDELVEACIAEISSLMEAKSLRNSYSLIFELDEKLPDLEEVLYRRYSSLKFECKVLGKSEGLGGPYLYLSWKNEKIS